MALHRTDGHAIWVSHTALAQTLEQLPGKRWPKNDEIDGGEIIRDEEDNPTGEHLHCNREAQEAEIMPTRCVRG